MEDTMQAEIKKILAEIFELEIEKITPEAHLINDLGADSMQALEAIATLEKKYRITIEPENFPQLISLKNITALVRKLTGHG